MKENGLIYTPRGATTASSPEPGMKRQIMPYHHNLMLVRHHFSKGWKGTSHSHPHEQLVYVVSGRIQFVGDGKTIELRSGVIVKGNVELGQRLSKTLKCWTCLFLIAKTVPPHRGNIMWSGTRFWRN